MEWQGCSNTNGMSAHARSIRSTSRVSSDRLASTTSRVQPVASHTVRIVSMSASTGRPPTFTCNRG